MIPSSGKNSGGRFFLILCNVLKATFKRIDFSLYSQRVNLDRRHYMVGVLLRLHGFTLAYSLTKNFALWLQVLNSSIRGFWE